MPQLIFKGVKREDVMHASSVLPAQLAEAGNTPIEYFTFEYPNTEFFLNGKEFNMYPLIEVKLFDRGVQTEKKMAELIQQEIKALGYDICEVFFTHIGGDDYYE